MSKHYMKESILEENEKISMKCFYNAFGVNISAFDYTIISLKMYTSYN